MSTIEMTQQHGQRLLEEFEKFFKGHAANPKGKFKTYVVRAGHSPARLEALKTLLDRNDIRYGQTRTRSGLQGYAYSSGKQETFSVSENDLVISAYQPKSVLVQTLFDPDPALSDSMTYDITSWALPYAYGLEGFAVETRLEVEASQRAEAVRNQLEKDALAYVSPWNAALHARFLSDLLKEKIRVRFATKDFVVSGQEFKAGSLIIGREGNLQHQDFAGLLTRIGDKHGVLLASVTTGYMDRGNDFGSSGVRAITAPKVALIGGSGVSSLNFGELWHYFEQDLQYPLSVLEQQQLNNADLGHYNVIILPSGGYQSLGESGFQKLSSWVASGGKLIAFESAISSLMGKSGFGISRYLTDDEKKAADRLNENESTEDLLTAFGERGRQRISNTVSGAVFKVKVDDTHPLGFGTDGNYFTLKNGSGRYSYLRNGVNAGVIPSMESHRSGFIGFKAKRAVPESLVFGLEQRGRGQIIYFVDNPIFRGFWESGKQLINNALFLVGQ